MTGARIARWRLNRRTFHILLAVIPALLILSALNSVVTSTPTQATAACVPDNQVGGQVYRDYNANGARDPREDGSPGVRVTAFDANGAALTSTLTISDGTYALNVGNGARVRVEFSNLPPGAFSGPFGADSVTSVSFAQSPNCDVDFGLSQPNAYCQSDPDIATNCYIFGPQTDVVSPVLVSFPYSAGGASLPAIDDPPTHPVHATSDQVGTTWGLAFQRESNSLFAAAFMKRHTGFGPGGSGAIYRIDRNTGSVSAFIDLNSAAYFAGSTGADPHGVNGYVIDTNAWDAVGKVAFGDIDLSEDGQTLWAINLFDRQLYEIPIGVPPSAPPAANIGRFPVPRPGDCADAEINTRPFGLGIHNGLTYVGLVCSAQTTQNPAQLRAYVYAFDPGPNTFAPALNFSLDYPRRCAVKNPTGAECALATWRPWITSFATISTVYSVRPSFEFIYPQPWLTDIGFDHDDMLIGLRDRYGDQMGYLQRQPDPTDARLYSGDAAGDVLRACWNGANWQLENNSSCGGVATAGANTAAGPGGGEFYFQENYPFHDETSLGGLVQVPGRADAIETVYDPVFDPNEEFDGGVLWLNNTTGARSKSHRIFSTLTDDPLTFGKAGGLGDLEAMCNIAPIEIGNRVWFDQNRNGIQDAETATDVITPELSLAGVTVHLYAPDGATLLATAVTGAGGEYYFSNAPGSSTASAVYNITGLVFNTPGYIVRLDNQADYEGGPLAQLALTPANVNGDADNVRDSDGMLAVPADPIGPGNYPQARVATRGVGDNDHTYDFGFFSARPATAIELLYFRVNGISQPQVQLGWATAAEIDNFGFNLYRASNNDFSRAELIHFEPSAIQGSGPGATYAYTDTVPTNGAWWYWLADVDTQAREILHGPVSASLDPTAALPYRLYLPIVVK
ncbi:MAG TPA: SdrD B-like domain-containing protein [Anaerolineae bacterium]|nr:SdrD B-like domain-containing protein [Anaerolineae bacterium]